MDIDLSPTAAAIISLLDRSERVLGLWIAMHDRLRCTGLPNERLQHLNPVCRAIRKEHQPECAAFCGGRVHEALAESAHGRIHTCPFGISEIVAPIRRDGLLAGVLFAGPCWRQVASPPHAAAIHQPPPEWLDDRLALLGVIAREIEHILLAERATSDDRQTRIREFLQQNLKQPLRIGELAAELHLSSSRAAHVVRECFGKSFAALVRELKLAEAAHRLRTTDLTIGAIGAEFSFGEQSHFTKLFKRQFRLTPGQYRKRFKTGI